MNTFLDIITSTKLYIVYLLIVNAVMIYLRPDGISLAGAIIFTVLWDALCIFFFRKVNKGWKSL